MKYLNFLISLFIYIYFKISINEFSAINNAHISPPTLIFLGGGWGVGFACNHFSTTYILLFKPDRNSVT